MDGDTTELLTGDLKMVIDAIASFSVHIAQLIEEGVASDTVIDAALASRDKLVTAVADRISHPICLVSCQVGEMSCTRLSAEKHYEVS